MPMVYLKNGGVVEVAWENIPEYLTKHADKIKPIKVKRRGAVRDKKSLLSLKSNSDRTLYF